MDKISTENPIKMKEIGNVVRISSIKDEEEVRDEIKS